MTCCCFCKSWATISTSSYCRQRSFACPTRGPATFAWHAGTHSQMQLRQLAYTEKRLGNIEGSRCVCYHILTTLYWILVLHHDRNAADFTSKALQCLLQLVLLLHDYGIAGPFVNTLLVCRTCTGAQCLRLATSWRLRSSSAARTDTAQKQLCLMQDIRQAAVSSLHNAYAAVPLPVMAAASRVVPTSRTTARQQQRAPQLTQPAKLAVQRCLTKHQAATAWTQLSRWQSRMRQWTKQRTALMLSRWIAMNAAVSQNHMVAMSRAQVRCWRHAICTFLAPSQIGHTESRCGKFALHVVGHKAHENIHRDLRKLPAPASHV